MFVNKRLPKLLRTVIILFSIIMVLAIPQSVFAHASLEKVTPVPDSHLQSSPKEILLLFNERIENELYSIKVFNNLGESISDGKTKLNVDQRQLTYTIPPLRNGNYTVSYSVISADGHPIKGSYIFSVGEASSGNGTQQLVDTQSENSFSIIRILYYFSLLLVTGWIIWGFANKAILEINKNYRKIALYLQLALVVTNIGFGYVQFSELLDSWNEIGTLLTRTTVGISWLSSSVLSLLGFIVLHRFTWLDRVWALSLLTIESLNGHSKAFEPLLLNISMDFIHLLAAAIWSGGLLNILVFWKKYRDHVQQFLFAYSKLALFSMMVLTLTGSVLTFTYLPDLHYLEFTVWGRWLLAKIVLVLFVIIIASIIRYHLKKKNEGLAVKWIKVDFTLMLLILFIVGIFTFLSPLPENQPLLWEGKENYIEFNAKISPKAPGDNMFMVDASSNKDGVNIKRIELFLKNKDNREIAPIQVPIAVNEQTGNIHYMVFGPYLPFAGNWTIEIRILDSDDDESVYHKDIIVY